MNKRKDKSMWEDQENDRNQSLKKSLFSKRTASLLILAGTAFTFYTMGKSDIPIKAESANLNSNYRSLETDKEANHRQNLAEELTNASENNTFIAPFSDKDGNRIVMKWENEVWKFSSDGGKNWVNDIPEGAAVDKNGVLSCKDVKDENTIYEFNPKEDQWRYSEDSGKTWTDPMKELEDWAEDSFSFSDGSGLSMKMEDGKMLYSTDGGKTWSEEIPESYAETVNAVLSKTEDGKTLYSTDGGKSWSEELPEGVEIPNIDDLLNDLQDTIDSFSDSDANTSLNSKRSLAI